MPRGRERLTVVTLLGILAAIPVGAELDFRDIQGKTLAECETIRTAHPRDIHAYLCFYVAAEQPGAAPAARSALESLLERDPADPRAGLYVGLFAANAREERAEALLRTSAEGFERERDARGEVWARISLGWNLSYRGQPDEGQGEIERALEVARSSGNESLVAEAELALGWIHVNAWRHGEAWTHLRSSARVLLHDGPPHLRMRLLDGLGMTAWALGRYEEAFDYYRQKLAARGGRDPVGEANDLSNMTLVARSLVRLGLTDEAELVRLEHETLAAARRSGNLTAEARALIVLAETIPTAEGHEHARRALEIARGLANRPTLTWALFAAAEHEARTGPDGVERALGLIAESEALAAAVGDPEPIARARLVRSVIHWNLLDWPVAIDDALGALDAIERIRDRQLDPDARARVFARFVHAYRRAFAILIESPIAPLPQPNVDLAFTVVERMRARLLLDQLDAARLMPAIEGRDALGAKRRELLDEVSVLHRRLQDPRLDDAGRRSALGRLAELESAERAIGRELAARDPRFAAARPATFPTIDAIRGALAPDQAAISFQAGWIPERPGSALVLTRDGVDVVPLPDFGALDQEVTTYLALIERRDGSGATGAARLHASLLGPVLRRLPQGIGRLILVPDGPLHRLPFASLTEGESGPAVGSRFEVTVMPSLSAWMRWKSEPPPDPPDAVLAIADPEIPADGWRAASDAGDAATIRTDGLGPLPHARAESRRIRRALGGPSRILTGAAADEAAVKRIDFARYRLLHLAAHTSVDDRNPELSAVLLAATGAEDDGRLEFREIVDLELRGPVVVLSACRSASGPVIGGDGAMGLAQAFFLAGSRTVLASLWPLRDDEAATLFGGFADALADGRTVAAALTEAQRAVAATGAPPAAWAGVVVMGDGDRILFADGPRRTGLLPIVLLSSLALLAGAALVARFFRRG